MVETYESVYAQAFMAHYHSKQRVKLYLRPFLWIRYRIAG